MDEDPGNVHSCRNLIRLLSRQLRPMLVFNGYRLLLLPRPDQDQAVRDSNSRRLITRLELIAEHAQCPARAISSQGRTTPRWS